MRYVLTPRARADLDEIWDHTAREWNPDKAETYVSAFRSAFEALTQHPRLGKPVNSIRRNYRALRVNLHVVFYKIEANQIGIIRILHEKADHASRLP